MDKPRVSWHDAKHEVIDDIRAMNAKQTNSKKRMWHGPRLAPCFLNSA